MPLAHAFAKAAVRYVFIGVAGANYYAVSAGTLFTTEDRDLFLPPDPRNELRALKACERLGMSLRCGDEPLGHPLDAKLAKAIVERRALVRATATTLEVDLALAMAGFDFETVWAERRLFRVEDAEIPVARLSHIVASKAAAGRPKDRLFLATHEDALRQLGRRRRGRRA